MIIKSINKDSATHNGGRIIDKVYEHVIQWQIHAAGELAKLESSTVSTLRPLASEAAYSIHLCLDSACDNHSLVNILNLAIKGSSSI